MTIRQQAWATWGSHLPSGRVILNIPRLSLVYGSVVLDFDVQKFTRVCAETGREFQPGEDFYAYLIREGGQTVRRDVCKEAWTGPPENCNAWWKSSVPDLHSKKKHWAPDDVLLHYFQETEDKPDEQDVRYLLTLLFIRRRLFKLVDSVHEESGESLMVTCARNDSEHTVSVVELTQERASEIQVLFSKLMVDVGSS